MYWFVFMIKVLVPLSPDRIILSSSSLNKTLFSLDKFDFVAVISLKLFLLHFCYYPALFLQLFSFQTGCLCLNGINNVFNFIWCNKNCFPFTNKAVVYLSISEDNNYFLTTQLAKCAILIFMKKISFLYVLICVISFRYN